MKKMMNFVFSLFLTPSCLSVLLNENKYKNITHAADGFGVFFSLSKF